MSQWIKPVNLKFAKIKNVAAGRIFNATKSLFASVSNSKVVSSNVVNTTASVTASLQNISVT